MTIKEYIQIIQKSNLEHETKIKIISLLENKENIDEKTREEIESIIQADINNFLENSLTEEEKKDMNVSSQEDFEEMREFERNSVLEFKEIQSDFERIENMISRLEEVKEKVRIQEIKNKIKSE